MIKKRFQQALLILFTAALIAIAGWSGFQVYSLSAKREEIKKDYSVLNNITFGLLSVNAWRDHMVRVVTHRIDDFQFTPDQEAALKHEVSAVLHAVIDKADSMVEKKQKTFKGKLKKFVVKALIDDEKVHAQVPIFAQTIVDELKQPKNREKLKFLAQSKLEEYGTITYDSANDKERVAGILAKYKTGDVKTFNHNSEILLGGLQEKTYTNTYIILSILLTFLVLWVLVRNKKQYHTPLFISSVLLAMVVLFIGLTTPMIEIDARIKEMSFQLIGEQIAFHDQVIFFQSKSIVDVVTILIQTGKFDSAVIGTLILIFSIIFPIGKLVSTKIYLLGSEKIRKNKVIQFFAFKSGKWSMADVYVIAIFMAYIGFKGILDSQLSNLNMKTESMASISTNQTSLQPGFILFVSFVLFSLILSVILQKITSIVVKQKVRIKKKRIPVNTVPTVPIEPVEPAMA